MDSVSFCILLVASRFRDQPSDLYKDCLPGRKCNSECRIGFSEAQADTRGVHRGSMRGCLSPPAVCHRTKKTPHQSCPMWFGVRLGSASRSWSPLLGIPAAPLSGTDCSKVETARDPPSSLRSEAPQRRKTFCAQYPAAIWSKYRGLALRSLFNSLVADMWTECKPDPITPPRRAGGTGILTTNFHSKG